MQYWINFSWKNDGYLRLVVYMCDVHGYICHVSCLTKCLVSHGTEQLEEKEMQQNVKYREASVSRKPPTPSLAAHLSEGLARRSHNGKDRILATLTTTIGTYIYMYIVSTYCLQEK